MELLVYLQGHLVRIIFVNPKVHFGHNISDPNLYGFLFSDISMAFVFIYVIRANQEKQVAIKKYDIDFGKTSGKILVLNFFSNINLLFL